MKTNKRQTFYTLRLAIILLLGALWGSLAFGFTPTTQQIEMFKSLSPEQQRALASQYGVDLNQMGLASGPAQPNLQPNQTVTRTTAQDNTTLEDAANKTIQTDKLNESASDTTTKGQLKQFGYDLFSGTPDAFTPASDIPPPDSYVLGPGDNLVVQLYGKENNSYSLTINREGQIQLPEIGPITLAGISFTDARALLADTVQQQMIGVKASVTMGTLRSIRIFVLGEALQPGSYTVSSLSTMTNALFASGGISKIGSLRNIQLKRQGKLITSLDLYDLLLNGDTSKDARLLPGDVIFIPPIGATAGVSGEVKRPAIYELKKEKYAAEVIELAGSYTPTAYPAVTRIERIDAKGNRTLVDADLTKQSGKNTKVQDADMIKVFSVLETMEDVVMLEGHVERPGGFAWHPGMRVTDIIHSAEELLPFPDLNVALIERETQPTREKTVLTFSLGEALKNPASAENIELKTRDKLYVFNFETPRSDQLKDLVARLKVQANKQLRKQTVNVSGYVRFPGEYPLNPSMSAKDMVMLAGGLTQNAYGLRGEITRITYSETEEQSIQHINVDLANSGSTALKEEDQLHIKRLPNWMDQETVTIEGEVKFPGQYKIKRGETLAQVIERAGGLNEWAYPEAAIFTREELRALEAQRLKELRDKLEGEIAAANLETQTEHEKIAVNEAQDLLESLNAVRPLGRMVIDLKAAINDAAQPIQLKDGDTLTIPRKKQAVTVVGEVQFPTSHIFESNADSEKYIEMSGGITQKADKKRIYVVKANGRVFLPEHSGWFKANNYKVEPGDTVVVPLDADRIKPLTLWTSISQVFYQIALGAAAVASF
ncbi:SLBB domain-containing protein [Ketobacter alkanivorans]|uniref:ATPase n=1 Tax=Ketobacter alkanivorans TaxID=1917421 RepID=A0A2K9LRR2_9GAMM|nr:SLBB domain-containing protein [Ketobacter alkanivorans]AUM14982.1 ATPase [Ketobacter alkanivorans]